MKNIFQKNCYLESVVRFFLHFALAAEGYIWGEGITLLNDFFHFHYLLTKWYSTCFKIQNHMISAIIAVMLIVIKILICSPSVSSMAHDLNWV